MMNKKKGHLLRSLPFLNKAIDDAIDDVVKHSVQIVETILPVEDIGDSTSVNIDVLIFKP